MIPPSAINTVPRYLRKGYKMDPPEGVDPDDLGWIPNGKRKPRTDDATMVHVAEAAGNAMREKENIIKGRAAISEVFGHEQAGTDEPDLSEEDKSEIEAIIEEAKPEAPKAEAPKPKARAKRRR